MPEHVLFRIPLAVEPYRVIIGALCLVFVLTVFGSWLPKLFCFARRLPTRGVTRVTVMTVGGMLPVAVGLAPLLILVALIKNPTTYVHDAGVMKQSLIFGPAQRLSWGQIASVSCRAGRGRGPGSITLVASDGRKLGMGNTRDVDFASLRTYLEDRLGPAVMNRCQAPVQRAVSAT
jgi:hypothetical protein